MAARTAFGPVVLSGLVGAGFSAVAGHQTMLRIADEFLRDNGLTALAGRDELQAEFPLAGALALVALACWGVLLVTRGVVRRVVAALALLAALGTLIVLIVGGFVQRDDAGRDVAAQIGYADSGMTLPMERTTWFWVGLACAVLAVAAAAVAARLVSAWPEMGSRYDAPTSGTPTTTDSTATETTDPVEQSNLDLWTSLDEGHDPTDGAAD